MLFDLSNILDRERFKRSCNKAYESGGIVELTAKSFRTRQQNRYLHLLLGYFASEYGETLEFVKEMFFKRLCNPDLFCERRTDKFMGEGDVLRSSRELTTAEMSVAIDRFRNWSSKEAGIYLPEADEREFLNAIEVELSRQQRYL